LAGGLQTPESFVVLLFKRPHFVVVQNKWRGYGVIVMHGIMGSISGDNSYAEFYLAPTFRSFEHTPYVTAGYVQC
jgi:hypothetical protein